MAPTTFKFFKIISFLMQEDNLVDDGGCNKIMLLNIRRLAQQLLSSEVAEVVD